MFKVGDYVAHYKEGVCEVTEIGKLDMSCSDKRKEYYTLKPLYDAGGTVYTPVSNEKKQIREVISAAEARTLLEELRLLEPLGVPDEKKREACYREAMLANQCRQWAALIKTSYLRKRKRMSCGKKAVSVDDRYLSMAEYFLTGELAIALDMSREAVRSCIIDNISE